MPLDPAVHPAVAEVTLAVVEYVIPVALVVEGQVVRARYPHEAVLGRPRLAHLVPRRRLGWDGRLGVDEHALLELVHEPLALGVVRGELDEPPDRAVPLRREYGLVYFLEGELIVEFCVWMQYIDF